MTYSLIYQCKLWCAYLTCEKYKTEHTNWYRFNMGQKFKPYFSYKNCKITWLVKKNMTGISLSVKKLIWHITNGML